MTVLVALTPFIGMAMEVVELVWRLDWDGEMSSDWNRQKQMCLWHT